MTRSTRWFESGQVQLQASGGTVAEDLGQPLVQRGRRPHVEFAGDRDTYAIVASSYFGDCQSLYVVAAS
ncbi:hypothetical protein GCM10025331_65100 [Actinoplanes utahensis]|nr:hypothetical protein Aut01nite_55600 [Actinoplanes utahensis]